MFLRIDILKNFAGSTGKHLCWSLFLIKLHVKFLRTPFIKQLQWLLLWFLQQSNLIFSVMTITFGYNQKLSHRNTVLPPSLYKISISYQKYAHLVQKFNSLSHQSPNFMTLWSTYFCMTLIFLRGGGGEGASHSYTVRLIVSLGKIDWPIYQEKNSPVPQKYSSNYSLVIKIHLKFIMLIKTSAIQNFKELSK